MSISTIKNQLSFSAPEMGPMKQSTSPLKIRYTSVDRLMAEDW